MNKNFCISVDSDGKIPTMSANPLKKHYVRYVNDVPVSGVLPEGMDRIWNYQEEEMYGLYEGLAAYPYDGKTFLPVIKNFQVLS